MGLQKILFYLIYQLLRKALGYTGASIGTKLFWGKLQNLTKINKRVYQLKPVSLKFAFTLR